MERKVSRLLPPVSGQTAATCVCSWPWPRSLSTGSLTSTVTMAIVYGLPRSSSSLQHGACRCYGASRWFWSRSPSRSITCRFLPALSSLGEPRFVDRVLCGLTLVLTASLLHIGLIVRRTFSLPNANPSRSKIPNWTVAAGTQKTRATAKRGLWRPCRTTFARRSI